MKKEMKFYSSLPLFIFTICLMWTISICLIYIFIITFDPLDFSWWLSAILIYGFSIVLPIIIYPRTMAKIYLNELGIKKIIFRKSKQQFIKWEDIKDIQMLTRPNGYIYVIISDKQIETESFENVLKDRNIIYFSYNEKAIQFIKVKLNNIFKTTIFESEKSIEIY